MTRTAPSRREVLLGSATAGGVLALTGIAAGPRPGGLGPGQGDPSLLEALAPGLDGHHRVSAAVLDDGPNGPVRFAGFGSDEHTEFEIGSVSKTFTGALLMEAIDRGEVTLATTVAEILGDRAAGSAIAEVTLAELASHSSGLPRLPLGRLIASVPGILLRRDRYTGVSADEVINSALRASVDGRGQYEYSNLGISLLGHLLAAVAGTTWRELLEQRLLDPLGLADTHAPDGPDSLQPEAPTGRTASGLSAGAWTNPGYGPSSTMRSTAADLSAYLRSMMDGSNPGAAGLDPTLELSSAGSIAITWHLRDHGKQRIISHNGMTGGFASYCGWNRDTGRAVVLLTATALAPEELGADFLEGRVDL